MKKAIIITSVIVASIILVILASFMSLNLFSLADMPQTKDLTWNNYQMTAYASPGFGNIVTTRHSSTRLDTSYTTLDNSSDLSLALSWTRYQNSCGCDGNTICISFNKPEGNIDLKQVDEVYFNINGGLSTTWKSCGCTNGPGGSFTILSGEDTLYTTYPVPNRHDYQYYNFASASKPVTDFKILHNNKKYYLVNPANEILAQKDESLIGPEYLGICLNSAFDSSASINIKNIVVKKTQIQPTTYQLTMQDEENGESIPSNGVYTYNKDTQVSVSTIPDSGYKIDYWLLDDSKILENSFLITMNHQNIIQEYEKELGIAFIVEITLLITFTIGAIVYKFVKRKV